MERWLSWSKAHDWKSCVRDERTEGSNPSLSATIRPKTLSTKGFSLFLPTKTTLIFNEKAELLATLLPVIC